MVHSFLQLQQLLYSTFFRTLCCTRRFSSSFTASSPTNGIFLCQQKIGRVPFFTSWLDAQQLFDIFSHIAATMAWMSSAGEHQIDPGVPFAAPSDVVIFSRVGEPIYSNGLSVDYCDICTRIELHPNLGLTKADLCVPPISLEITFNLLNLRLSCRSIKLKNYLYPSWNLRLWKLLLGFLANRNLVFKGAPQFHLVCTSHFQDEDKAQYYVIKDYNIINIFCKCVVLEPFLLTMKWSLAMACMSCNAILLMISSPKALFSLKNASRFHRK